MNRELPEFAVRSAVAAAVACAVVAALAVFWRGIDVLLLVFAGLLLAILLRGAADRIARATGLSGGWSLSLLLLAVLAVGGAGGWFVGSGVAEQFADLSEELPKAVATLRDRLASQRWGRELLGRLPEADGLVPDRGEVVSGVVGLASGTFGAIGSAVVVLFVGLFVAYEPGLYRRGLLRLVPPRGRRRAGEVLDAVGDALRGWMAGQAFSMTVVGVFTVLGLSALGVPLAIPLGIIAALLTFIPNIGPVLSVVPAVLLALPEGAGKALAVVGLFVAIQAIESNVLTPIVQRNLIALPPALVLSAQALLGVLLGTVGLLVATPLTAAAMVAVNMLYVEDVLGDPAGDPDG